ncbi:hypothetical protein ALC57_16248 [Trachymyrmex cornetzi]|uniref:Uncharacterized protein n=1 Tax=Trachymyrmex cornetzi TaxID=471704 RepID=A0A195DGS5_9HYME|nr:hypothetical protein ALC57_16248 [Trachymyrmex cornetzi]
MIISVAREVNICQPLSPVCWRMWLTRCSFLVNDLEQKPHRCGDSPVCWRTWFRRCSFRVNVFEQKSQRCGVSPVCHIMWFVKCSFLVNDLPAYRSVEQKKSIENRCASLDCNTRRRRFILYITLFYRHITNRMIGTIPRHVVVRN